MLVNADSDESPPARDWVLGVKSQEGARELAVVRVSPLGKRAKSNGWTVKLSIGAAPLSDDLMGLGAAAPKNRIRVYYKDKQSSDYYVDGSTFKAALGRGVKASEFEVPVEEDDNKPDLGGNDPVELFVEGCDFGSDVYLVAKLYDRNNKVISEDKVRIMCAPFIDLPNTRDVERVFVSANAGQLLARLRDLVGSDSVTPTPVPAPAEPDQWVQDQWEFGTTAWPPNNTDIKSFDTEALPNGLNGYPVMPAAVALPRVTNADTLYHFQNANLAGIVPDQDYPATARNMHLSWQIFTTGGGPGDFGGNVEVSPPAAGAPLGRIVVGANAGTMVKNFLKRQRVQAKRNGNTWELIELGTSWLAVGHVDEVISFVPGGGGFAIAVASWDAAKGILGDDPADLGNRLAYSTFFYGNPNDNEVAGVVTASDSTTLTDANANFDGFSQCWVRIYADPDEPVTPTGQPVPRVYAGQVALASATSKTTLKVLQVYRLPTAADVAAAVDGVPAVSTAWTTVPAQGCRYVVVGGSKLWHAVHYPPGTADFPAIVTAHELRHDAELWARNEAAQSAINGIVNQLSSELGASFIDVPAVYFGEAGQGSVAYVPGMVNHVVVNGHLLIPRPFGPRFFVDEDGNSDSFLQAALTNLTGNGRAIDAEDVIDDWDLYHRIDGELHCATGVRRVPSDLEMNWWEYVNDEDYTDDTDQSQSDSDESQSGADQGQS